MVDSAETNIKALAKTTGAIAKFKTSAAVFQASGFSWLLAANAAMFAGFQMRNMGQAWLVLELTDSAFLVGLVNAMPSMALLLLSPFGGVLADRYSKKTVAFRGRFFVMLISFGVAFLVSSGAVLVWHLLITGFALGVAFALSNPASQTIVMDIVGRTRMVSAVSLNNTVSNLGVMVGSAIGGVLLATYGNAAIFWLTAGIYVVAWVGFFGVPGKAPSQSATGEAGWSSAFSQMSDGLKYAWRTSRVKWLLFTLTGAMFWGVVQPLIPVFARDILEVGPSGFGALIAATGAGALAGALVIFIAGNLPKKGLLVILSTIVIAICYSLFAISEVFAVSLVVLAVSGLAGSVWMTSIFTLLQMTVDEEMRGRVMGLAMSAAMLLGLGFMIGGLLADVYGPRVALHVSAGLWILWGLIAYWRSPELRNAN
ncbi:MAG: MFS transporter [Chloroflexi bacterium]|nr:MFS transporter [Chloroflexota bacterium]